MMFPDILNKRQWARNVKKTCMASCLLSLISFTVCLGIQSPAIALENSVTIHRGKPLPNASMIETNGERFNLSSLKGQVTLISVVPQLHTPVCDEQTHRFSENNDGLDQDMIFVTMSTNTSEDQANFAHKAKIRNMTFLSDAPDYQFGRQTGLLQKDIAILQRAVIVLDEALIVRYVEIVPMSQLPNFEQAYRIVRSLIFHPS